MKLVRTDHYCNEVQKIEKEANLDKIIIKIGRKYYFLDKSSIDWIEADEGYIKVHSNQKYFHLRMTLRDIEKKLNSDYFIRINRSTIVNMQKIKELETGQQSTEFIVRLENDVRLNWRRQYRKNFPVSMVYK